MEEDDEFVKKLMHLLGNGKELKLKSNNGQTIRVILDGSSFNETEESTEKMADIDEAIKGKSSSNSPDQLSSDLFQQKQQQEEPFFVESLQQISSDFNALTTEVEKATPHQTLFSEDNFESMIFMDLEKLKEKESDSSVKTEDHVVKEFIHQIGANQIQPQRSKIKKISLNSKCKKSTNQPVIDFFKDDALRQQFSLQIIPKLSMPGAVNSSPVMWKQQQQKSTSKSEKVQENINLLKQRHPQEQKTIQLISQRLQQLQQKSKIVDQSLSLINSSSISRKLDSFDLSVLSFQRNSDDPLCIIMSQFLHRAKMDASKGKIKSVSSSFLFMFSQPLVTAKGREIEEQINYFEEEAIIQKTLKEGKCKVDYIHEPATAQKMHYWMQKGMEIVHFCGHGVYDPKRDGNYLLFQNQRGESVNITSQRLKQLLSDGANNLKLVFVASCHSQSAGKVFSEAGASHVICIRDQYQILDEACQQFVKLFYLTCINSKTSICESFAFARRQLQLKGKYTKHQCQKFIILKNHGHNECHQYFQHRNESEAFNDLNHRPAYSRVLLSRVQHYIPRCRDMYEVVKLINAKRRFITITGQSGIGKSTLVRQLVRYLQFRNYFRDGIVFLDLRRCGTMHKIYQVMALELFETSQLKLGKSAGENALRIAKELSDKNLLIIFDNCQHIMGSDERQGFKKLAQQLMKASPQVLFMFTNRHSIGRQIDYCSEVQYELGRLSLQQAKTLFFSKISRDITKQQMQDFFALDREAREVSQHSFFNFLNGHPEAICMTASLVAYRSLKQLYEMLTKPSISSQLNRDIGQYGINNVVSTAIRISLNVINHKYRDASDMVKILSLLPNGLQAEMMSKIFPPTRWRDSVKKLMNHSLVSCIEKGGSRYFLLHPLIIIEVEKEMSLQEKMKYHDKIVEELGKKIKRIYENVGTLSPLSQKNQEIFHFEEDNYKAVFLRQIFFAGERAPLRRFYQNVFGAENIESEGEEAQCQSESDDFQNVTAQILASYERGKKVKSLALQKASQKKEPVDVFMVFYVTILFVVKKVKNISLQSYLNYGIVIAHRKNKMLVLANLLRVKACIFLSKSDDVEAKRYFSAARAEFAQQGCGLGSACCEAAIGYIKYCEHQYASAKMYLENALKYYDEVPHAFGKHYLNRWLCSLKTKMNRGEKQLLSHKLQAQKLLKQAKSNLRSNNLNNISLYKHKFGCFPFRFLFDNISLFLQASFEVDLKPKFISHTSVTTSVVNNHKKNNFILDEIHQELPVTALFQPKIVADQLKKREVSRRMEKKKAEKVHREVSRQFEKLEYMKPALKVGVMTEQFHE